jgi:hypothetical protein
MPLPVWVQCRLEDLPGDHEWTPLARESVLLSLNRLLSIGVPVDEGVAAIEKAFAAGMTVKTASTSQTS